MTVTKTRTLASLAGATAIALAVLSLASTGSASAAETNPNDKGGPVIYLSRHGGPTHCTFDVTTWDENGILFEKARMDRDSCDGTLWLRPGVRMIHIDNAESLGDRDIHNIDVVIKDVKDDWAYCVLAKAAGDMHYTNSGPKGGDCNGD